MFYPLKKDPKLHWPSVYATVEAIVGCIRGSPRCVLLSIISQYRHVDIDVACAQVQVYFTNDNHDCILAIVCVSCVVVCSGLGGANATCICMWIPDGGEFSRGAICSLPARTK
jgi:hypothetical protein